MPQNLPSLKLLGCRIDKVTWQLIDGFCRQSLSSNQPKQIITLNGEIILIAQSNKKFQDIINQADLVIPDSTNVVWISRLKGDGLPMITPGSDLVVRLANLANLTKSSIFFLGGRPGIAKNAAENLKKQLPNLIIAGVSDADPDNQNLVKEIKSANADIVLVAYGGPAQEMWIAENKLATGAKILVGIGGTFDMLAGILPRAPHWLRSLHLEWLWRLILQPSRLTRIWRALVVFPIKALFNT